MKKIIVFILCAILLCATPIMAFADGEPTAVTETVTEVETTPTVVEEPITDIIVNYVKEHFEEILVVVFLALGKVFEKRSSSKLSKYVGTLNNNAVAIAESGNKSSSEVLAKMEEIAGTVKDYKEEFATLIAECRKMAEEKQTLEETLNQVEAFLKTAKLATLELSNEVAELLVLANIPTSKKDELYARHTKAVREIEVAAELEYFMRKHGAEDKSFETISISAEKTSLPHGVPENVKIKKGFFTE